MAEKLSGKELLLFLRENPDMTRADQALESGFNTILEMVEAIALANRDNPDFWRSDDSSNE